MIRRKGLRARDAPRADDGQRPGGDVLLDDLDLGGGSMCRLRRGGGTLFGGRKAARCRSGRGHETEQGARKCGAKEARNAMRHVQHGPSLSPCAEVRQVTCGDGFHGPDAFGDLTFSVKPVECSGPPHDAT